MFGFKAKQYKIITFAEWLKLVNSENTTKESQTLMKEYSNNLEE